MYKINSKFPDKELKKIIFNILIQLDNIMEDTTGVIFQESSKIIAKEATNTSNLLASISTDTERFLKKGINFKAFYAPYVNYGTKPHMPPPDDLAEWARLKFGLTEKEAKKAGWAIAMKIKKKGTEGVFFAERSRDKGEMYLEKKLRNLKEEDLV